MEKKIVDISLGAELSTEEFCQWLSAMATEIRARKRVFPLDWNEEQSLQKWIEELPSLASDIAFASLKRER